MLYHLYAVDYILIGYWRRALHQGEIRPEKQRQHDTVYDQYEIGDKELTVLPQHTKVTLNGINRRNSVLVELPGVVKMALEDGTGW